MRFDVVAAVLGGFEIQKREQAAVPQARYSVYIYFR